MNPGLILPCAMTFNRFSSGVVDPAGEGSCSSVCTSRIHFIYCELVQSGMRVTSLGYTQQCGFEGNCIGIL